MGDFPKLMWLPDGREITVQDQREQDDQRAAGARLTVTAEPPVEAEADESGDDVPKSKKKGK